MNPTTTGNLNYSNSIFGKLISFVQDIVSDLFPIITAILIILLAWTIFRFMKAQGGEDKAASKKTMFNALVALFIWFTFFGIIQVVATSFGLGIGDDVNNQQTTTVKFQ